MAESVQIASFEGGQLTVQGTGEKSREAVLALPLNRLLVKVVRIPAENRDDPISFLTPIMQALSPYPDESLTVSYETIRETEEGLVVFAAALPESAADDIGVALDEAKLNVTRIDSLALGRLRMIWNQLEVRLPAAPEETIARQDVAPPSVTPQRKIVLLPSVDCISLFVLDGDLPCAVRAISLDGDLKRDIMLALLEAEDFNGASAVAEIVIVNDVSNNQLTTNNSQLAAFAPIRTLAIPDDSLDGVAARTLDPDALNALPESWREVLEETRFKSKLTRFLVTAGVIWALVMATLFGVPLVYGFMTDHQKTLSKEHARRYREVKDMREKVKLVQKYSDHNRGALEILKAVSDRLPEGVELNSWNFRRDEGVKFSGESADKKSVYLLKDRLLATKLLDEDGEEMPLFAIVELTGPSQGRGNKQRFDIDCYYEAEEEE